MMVSNMSARVARLWLEAKATGSRTGDGTEVGLFFPLPKALAKGYPKLSEDGSPSHVTLLYLGDVRGREEAFLETTRKIFEMNPWPKVKATLGGVDYFEHPERRISIQEVFFDRDVSSYRRVLIAEYAARGFQVDTKWPEFRPHVTLSYDKELQESPVPEGDWDIDSVEVWGLPKPYTIQTTRPKTAKYQSKKKLPNGNEILIYGPRQISNRHKQKADKLENLKGQMTKLRAKVRDDLGKEDVALVVALIDETFERVGNPGSADDGHFGVTGWRKKHVSFKKGKAVIKYVGKSGVSHEKEVTDKRLVTLLKKTVEGLSDEDELFPEVESKEVNEYLKPFGATAKDIRGFHANTTMKESLQKQRSKGPKLPTSRKEKDKILKDEFKEALEETAELVGHESATLRSQYLVPGLEDSYLHDGTVMKSMVKGTKTRNEVEDDQVGSMLRREPKSKPPRYDLRTNHLKEEDRDLQGLGAGDKGDRDLSMNSKKIARLWLRNSAASKPDPKDKEHKPGDVWKTDSGFRGMSPKGESETFEKEDEAKAFAKGKAKAKPEPEPELEPEPEKPRVKGDTTKKVEEIASQLLKGDVTLDKDVSLDLEEALGALDPKEAEAFEKAVQEQLEVLVSQDGFSPESAKNANRSIRADFSKPKNAEDLAKMVSALMFARNVTANPLILGGVKVSKGEKSPAELSERAEQAFRHFKRLDPALIEHAAESMSEAIRSAEKDPDSPLSKELQAILSGLNLASIVKAGKGVSGRPEPSEGMVAAIRRFVKDGQTDILLTATEDLYKPSHQRKFKKLLIGVPDEEFFALMSKKDEDSPYKPLKELFEGGLSSEWKDLLKEWMADDYLKDSTWHDSAVRDALKHSGKEDSPETRADIVAKMRDNWKKKLFENWQSCLSEASSDSAKKNCKDQFSKANMILLSAESSKDFLDRLEESGLELPNSASVAVLDQFGQTGDPRILETKIEPHPERFSERKAHLSPYKEFLPDRNSAQRYFFMTTISKKAAKNIIATFDEVARFIQNHGASAIGVDPRIAMDLAKRIDMMSVLFERKVAYQDKIDPVENFTLTPKVPTNFESDDIGAEDSGALLRDADEPYEDSFKQDRFRQLREVQQGNQFSNAKAASLGLRPEEFAQLSEVQKSGMFSNNRAASALILKQAQMLDKLGVSLVSKKK